MAGFACFVAVNASAAALLTALFFDLFFFVITFKVARWQNWIPSFPWIVQSSRAGRGAQSKEGKGYNFAA